MLEIAFCTISGLLTVILVVIAALTFRDGKNHSRYLGLTIVFAACVNVTYIASVVTDDYFRMTVWSSVYFCCFDFMLIFLYSYAIKFTHMDKQLIPKVILVICIAYAAFDIVSLMRNPLDGAALSYEFNSMALVAHWRYVPHALFRCHLVFTYCLVALVIIVLVIKSIRTPRFYRGRYTVLLAGFIVVVAMNAVFLFLPNNTFFDFSIWFYCVLAAFFWWNSFHFSENRMMKNARRMIIDFMDHPVILFDYEERLITRNEKAEFLFREEDIDREYTLREFVSDVGFDELCLEGALEADSSFQFTGAKQGLPVSYRCEFKLLYDERAHKIGYLFVLTENSLEIDWLTGFDTKESFMRQIREGLSFETPVSVAALDLNRLALLNKSVSREAGDKAIALLADAMRTYCVNAHFVRLDDANLLAVCENTESVELRNELELIASDLSNVDLGCGPLEIQSAVSLADGTRPDILATMETAMDSVRAKKMLDSESAHSSLLDSLVQALCESDYETEAHVRRTRAMGARLGSRLGLTDLEQSSLALLCMLHDIGKLGVPLEILNKPGKLAEEEWSVMKSHVEKGYRICKASTELTPIADLVLHHHECWDGSGYPDGLAKESIPLLSRIISIVDTYDAMTNDRPYRVRLSNAEAVAELRRCAGKQFDPHIVAELLSMLEEEGVDTHEVSTTGILRSYGLVDTIVENEEPQTFEHMAKVTYGKYVVDANERIISIDEGFTKLTGYTLEDVETYGLTQADLIFPEDRDSYMEFLVSQLRTKHEAYIEHRLRRKDGVCLYVFCYGSQFYSSAVREGRSTIVIADVIDAMTLKALVGRERESARRSLGVWQASARKDSLTGLLNREAFRSEVAEMLLDPNAAVLMAEVDVDFFKQYNDAHGHPAGDSLLCLLAKLLQGATSSNGIAARLGGDEFMVALKLGKDADHDSASESLKLLWGCVSDPFWQGSSGVTVTMGAALAKSKDSSYDDLYYRVDKALYMAKESGRNRYTLV